MNMNPVAAELCVRLEQKEEEVRRNEEEARKLREEIKNALAQQNTAQSAQCPFDHYNHEGAVTKRPRASSQHSALAPVVMSRSLSSQSAQSAVPFTGPGVQGPRPAFRGLEQQGERMIDFWAQEDGPYSFGHSRTRPHPSLPGENPDAFLQRVGEDEDLSSENSPTMGTSVYLLSPNYCMAPPALTDAPTVPSMSRQNSQLSSPSVSLAAVDMIRLESTQSNNAVFQSQDNSALSFGASAPIKSCQDDLMHIGVGQSLKVSHQYPNSVPADQLAPEPKSQPMSRSCSNESTQSTKSNSSLKERAKEALTRHVKTGNLQASIQPKPSSENQGEDDQTPNRGGAAGGKKDTKEAINRQPYQRPKHPKVYCSRCDYYPDGFRGEHELRRHTDAKHKGLVTKYVVRDAFARRESTLRPHTPISKCKSCTSGKQYGAYYNAAAHLRRAHFRPKTGRRASKNSESDEGKRRQGTGQDWPQMDELKKWFYSVLVDVNSPAEPPSQASVEDTSQPRDALLTPQVSEASDADTSNIGPSFDFNTAPIPASDADTSNMGASFDFNTAPMPASPFNGDFNNLDMQPLEFVPSNLASISTNFDQLTVFNPSMQLSVDLAEYPNLAQSTPRSFQLSQELSMSTTTLLPNISSEEWHSALPGMIDGLEAETDF